jgi:hypothetical protein
VIGINSQKLVKKNITGISFALSASDLLEVLRRFYPLQAPSAGNSANDSVSRAPAPSSLMTAPLPAGGVVSYGTVEIRSEPDGAEIYLDDQFLGSTPSMLRVSEGAHTVMLKLPGRADWRRSIRILKESNETVKAIMEPL